MSNKKLFLLDAYALIFRAYYAFIRNPRINSKGLNTSAIFGFVNALEDILKNQDPSHIAVAFDHKSPNVRVQEYEFYKANRDETPEDIKKSEPWIRKIIEAYDIPIVEMEGYEADDVIGTLSKQAEKQGFEVYMMTPDKDFGQLVSERIFMYKPGRQGKKAEVLGPKEICEKYMLDSPEQFIDILGLMGDAVDNIPGVKGVGEKTAMKLISQYKSVEGVYENIEEIKGKLKEKLETDHDNALISKKLATIILDVPIELDESALELNVPDKEKLGELFSELEFRTLGRRVLGDEFTVSASSTSTSQSAGHQPGLFDSAPSAAAETVSDMKNLENTPHKYECVDNQEKRASLIAALLKSKEFVFDTETTGLNPILDDIVGLAFSFKAGEGYYVPLPEEEAEAKAILKEFVAVFASPASVKIAHNLKFDMKVLMRYDIEIAPPFYDTMVAHYIAYSNARHKMDILAENYLQYQPMPIEALIGKKGPKQGTMRDVPLEKVTEYASEDADITLQLKPIVSDMVKKRSDGKILEELDLPLIPILANMEWSGIKVDADFLNDYSKTLGEDIVKLSDEVFKLAGTDFNLDSPKQLGEVLFDHMKLPYTGSRTKTGQYSTNEDTLSKLRDQHEVIDHVLNYRELTKLKSTYVDAIPQLINPKTGRVHTTFSQTIAATGRLSSINPNLQNIPIRTERGRQVRKAFVPGSPDHILLAADYSQIELRIIAEISGDENMLTAFQKGEDIHAATASKVFGIPLDEVSREHRRQAKAVNFGLAYGQSAFGLSQTLGIKRSEARAIIDNYFEQFPKIRAYMSSTVDFAREHGYVETIMHRRRYLRDINSKNHTVRAGAERNAINSPIQGSAADMIKKAMIDIFNAMKKQGMKSKMILQVHDELVFDVLHNEMNELKALVEDKMKNALPDLKVPILVDMGTGQDWLEAH